MEMWILLATSHSWSPSSLPQWTSRKISWQQYTCLGNTSLALSKQAARDAQPAGKHACTNKQTGDVQTAPPDPWKGTRRWMLPVEKDARPAGRSGDMRGMGVAAGEQKPRRHAQRAFLHPPHLCDQTVSARVCVDFRTQRRWPATKAAG